MSSMKDQFYGNSTCIVVKGILLQRICTRIHRESVHQISGLYKHAQQQFNNACTCHNVCQCVYYQTGLLYATYMYNHLVCASVLCT